MDDHILDRPIWSALTTTHSHFSIGSQRARRFESDISPFAAARDESEQSLSDLAALIPDNGQILIAQTKPIIPPFKTRPKFTATAYQMVYEGGEFTSEYKYIIDPLTLSDGPAMMELAAQTKPGPFLDRTHLLGEFWGVKKEGQLIAMAGERLKQPGFTEISGVCTHPDFQGKGLGRELCIAVSLRITDRGETPYLHVFSDNSPAIKLYNKLGFNTRRTMQVAALENA
jgi:ribosomal protein S18 acetylase RimI-like enzyme